MTAAWAVACTCSTPATACCSAATPCALLAGSHACQALELMPAEIELFALLEDLQARGIEDVPARLVAVDYPGFVELATRFDKVNSWL